jgi:hypothetical protein
MLARADRRKLLPSHTNHFGGRLSAGRKLTPGSLWARMSIALWPTDGSESCGREVASRWRSRRKHRGPFSPVRAKSNPDRT